MNKHTHLLLLSCLFVLLHLLLGQAVHDGLHSCYFWPRLRLLFGTREFGGEPRDGGLEGDEVILVRKRKKGMQGMEGTRQD